MEHRKQRQTIERVFLKANDGNFVSSAGQTARRQSRDARSTRAATCPRDTKP